MLKFAICKVYCICICFTVAVNWKKQFNETLGAFWHIPLWVLTVSKHRKAHWSLGRSKARGKEEIVDKRKADKECQVGDQPECHAMKSHHITEMSSQIYAHFASEHQPRRQKICKRELLISTDRKTLEKVILRLRCLGAKIFVVYMTHEFQPMSTIQEIIVLIILQMSPT